MSAGQIIVIIVGTALLFAIRAGVRTMSAALDRLTASVSAATAALNDAANAPQVPEQALTDLADSLDTAVTAYRTATGAGVSPDAGSN